MTFTFTHATDEDLQMIHTIIVGSVATTMSILSRDPRLWGRLVAGFRIKNNDIIKLESQNEYVYYKIRVTMNLALTFTKINPEDLQMTHTINVDSIGLGANLSDDPSLWGRLGLISIKNNDIIKLVSQNGYAYYKIREEVHAEMPPPSARPSPPPSAPPSARPSPPPPPPPPPPARVGSFEDRFNELWNFIKLNIHSTTLLTKDLLDMSPEDKDFIKNAHRAMVKITHPDKIALINPDDQHFITDDASNLFNKVNTLWASRPDKYQGKRTRKNKTRRNKSRA